MTHYVIAPMTYQKMWWKPWSNHCWKKPWWLVIPLAYFPSARRTRPLLWVTNLNEYSLLYYILSLLITPYHFPQAYDNFWKVKYNHEAAKQARAAKRAERKAAKTGTSRKKKPSASDLLKLDDTSDEEEVILNSPDSFVIILLTLYLFRKTKGTAELPRKR